MQRQSSGRKANGIATAGRGSKASRAGTRDPAKAGAWSRAALLALPHPVLLLDGHARIRFANAAAASSLSTLDPAVTPPSQCKRG